MNSWTRTFFVWFCLLGAISLSTACQTTSRYQPGMPCEISVQEARNQIKLSLRNESLSSPQSQYSAVRDSAGAKVISDELMEYLFTRWEELGYFDLAKEGKLPAQLPSHEGFGYELQLNHKNFYAIKNRASSPENSAAFSEMLAVFREIYNGTFQAQRINREGKEYFREQQKKLEQGKQREGVKP